jgi:hypothetical protein
MKLFKASFETGGLNFIKIRLTVYGTDEEVFLTFHKISFVMDAAFRTGS